MLDLTKPVETQDGRKVRILCTDRKGTKWPVIALVTNDADTESTFFYTKDGMSSSGAQANLINPKKKLYLLVWDNAHQKNTVCSYESEAARTVGIASCHNHGWKVNKVLEIEVD